MPIPSLFDRPSVAAVNLAQGEFSAAGRALLSPGTLPPHLLRTTGQVAAPEEEEGFVRSIVNVLGNPLFILGAMLAARFPIAGAKSLFQFKQGLVGWKTRLGPVMRRVSSLPTQLAGTTLEAPFRGAKDLPGLIGSAALESGHFSEKHTKVFNAALSEFQKSMHRDLTPKESARIAAYLSGLHTSKFGRQPGLSRPLLSSAMVKDMSPAERKLADTWRQGFQGVWSDVWGTLSSQQQQALEQELAKQGFKVGKELSQYFPHMVQMSNADYQRMIKGMLEVSGGRRGVAGQMAATALSHRASRHLRARRGWMAPDLDDLKHLQEYLDPVAVRELEAKVRLRGDNIVQRIAASKDPSRQAYVELVRTVGTSQDVAAGLTAEFAASAQSQGLRAALRDFRGALGSVDRPLESPLLLRKYSLRLVPVTERYVRSMSNQHVWTTLGYGREIRNATSRLDPLGKTMMQDTYIPQLLGRPSFEQSIQSLEWSSQRDKWLTSLESPKGLLQHVPKGTRDWLRDRLLEHRGPMTLGAASGGIARYFYTTTLGLNPSSAIRNTLQTVITTAPTIGWGHTLKGMGETRARVGTYFKLRYEQKLSPDEAFQQAFREFTAARVDPSPISEKMMKENIESIYASSITGLSGPKMKRALDMAQDKMLSMFTATERWNRLVAFYGGRSKGLADGLSRTVGPTGLSELDDFARAVVQRTQFPAGVGETPYMISQWPAPFRQFLHFPMRYMEFLGASTMMGPGQGRNWGAVGRTLIGSTVAYEAGKALLDTDLSGGLMTGALPLPMGPEMPFYPMPIVPPALGLVGSAAMAMHEGSIEPLRRSVPLLVPGGVALNRLRRVLPPQADYKNRTPDGRIPLYTERGSLIGYMGTGDLVRRTLGFGGVAQAQERQLMEYLLQQRDAIRAYRRDFLQALARNDQKEAESIQQEFQQRFPGFRKITVKREEIDAMQFRMRVTRLERVLDTLPPEHRQQYAEMVSEALGQETRRLMNVDPELLRAPGSNAQTRRAVGGGRQPPRRAGTGGEYPQYPQYPDAGPLTPPGPVAPLRSPQALTDLALTLPSL